MDSFKESLRMSPKFYLIALIVFMIIWDVFARLGVFKLYSTPKINRTRKK